MYTPGFLFPYILWKKKQRFLPTWKTWWTHNTPSHNILCFVNITAICPLLDKKTNPSFRTPVGKVRRRKERTGQWHRAYAITGGRSKIHEYATARDSQRLSKTESCQWQSYSERTLVSTATTPLKSWWGRSHNETMRRVFSTCKAVNWPR